MKTLQNIPKIIKFQKHKNFLAIDWESLKHAFSITVEDGDAIMHTPSLPTSKIRFAIGSAIGVEQIREFFLRQDPETKLIEVILKVTYEPYEKILGVTGALDEAKEWVSDANKIVKKHQKK